MSAHVIVRHACDAAFTLAQWDMLRFVGVQEDEAESHELRNRTCGSTIAWALAGLEVVAEIDELRARVATLVARLDRGNTDTAWDRALVAARALDEAREWVR